MSLLSPVWWERRRGENRTYSLFKSAQIKKIIIYGDLVALNMAKGSTGFSKSEIDAMMEVLDGQGWEIQYDGPFWRAYHKLKGVQRRLS